MALSDCSIYMCDAVHKEEEEEKKKTWYCHGNGNTGVLFPLSDNSFVIKAL